MKIDNESLRLKGGDIRRLQKASKPYIRRPSERYGRLAGLSRPDWTGLDVAVGRLRAGSALGLGGATQVRLKV